MSKAETRFLYDWKLKLAVLVAIVAPTVSITGAYWKLRVEITEAKAQSETRLNAVELSAQKSFAEKSEIKEVSRKVDTLALDMREIKSMLRRR